MENRAETFTATHPELGDCICDQHALDARRANGWSRKPDPALVDAVDDRSLPGLAAAGIWTAQQFIEAATNRMDTLVSVPWITADSARVSAERLGGAL